jgi:hypothetical protein
MALCVMSLAACGGGGGVAPTPADTLEPLQASFGVSQPLTGNPITPSVDVRVYNYSNAYITDMGLRPLGTQDAWIGQPAGWVPPYYGAKGTGNPWLSVAPGGYEIFVQTNFGTIHASGYTPTLSLPSGDVVAGPVDVYIWRGDLDGQLPPTGGGGGTTTIP